MTPLAWAARLAVNCLAMRFTERIEKVADGDQNSRSVKSSATGRAGGGTRRCEPSLRHRWAIRYKPGIGSQGTNLAVAKKPSVC